MASKYVVKQPFDNYQEGDPIPMSAIGDNEQAWVDSGRIALRDTSEGDMPVTPAGVTVPRGGNIRPLATPAPATVRPAAPASFVTLGSSVTGMPAFVMVETEQAPAPQPNDEE